MAMNGIGSGKVQLFAGDMTVAGAYGEVFKG